MEAIIFGLILVNGLGLVAILAASAWEVMQ